MKSKVEVGQVVYVTSISMFTDNKPNLTPYKVTKVNGSSFYAYNMEGHSSRQIEDRFSHRDMTHKTGFGYNHVAYLSEEDYWSRVRLAEEKRELRSEISKALPHLKHKQLLAVKELLDLK